jgi:hypothetical protein
MITTTDITKLKKTFATKKDLKRLEKRIDKRFENYATRDELREMFSLVATKSEMEKGFAEIRLEMQTGFSEVFDKIDSFMGKTVNNEDELKVLGRQIDRHERWITKASKKTGVKYKR